MLDTPFVSTSVVSVLTLALSRCRCIVGSTPEGHAQWGLGYTDAELFPRVPPDPPEALLEKKATTIIRDIYVLEAFDIFIFCLHVDWLASSPETAYPCKTSIELL